MKYYIRGLKKYFKFSGRDSRKEYWIYSIISLLVIVAIPLLYAAASNNERQIVTVIIAILSFHIFPSLAAGIRRLHDTDKSAWWCLLWFFPYVGFVIQFILLFTKGTEGPNRFGPDPYCSDTSIWPLYTQQSATTYRAKLFRMQALQHLEDLLETGAIDERAFERRKKTVLAFGPPNYTREQYHPASNGSQLDTVD